VVSDAERSSSSSSLLGSLLRRRGLVLFAGSTLYAAVAAVRASAVNPARGDARQASTAGLIGVFLSLVATRPAPTPSESTRGALGVPLDATAYATWGLAMTIVSLSGGSAWVDALGVVGTCTAAAAACAASRTSTSPPGVAASMLRIKPVATYLALVLLAVPPLLAVLSCALPGARGLLGREGLSGLGAWSAVLSLGATAAVYADRLRANRHVLGTEERARAAFGSAVGVFGVAVAILVTRTAPPTPVLELSAASAGVLASVSVSFRNAVLLARIGRRVLALLLFGGPVVLLSALAAEGFGGAGPTAALVGGAVALGVGTLGGWLERPLRPAEGRWLDAIVLAMAALARADPETSLESALAALRAAAGTSSESPELWLLEPMRVVTIDAAGYARERSAAVPPLLFEIAAAEPEATVRTELLEALLVRRPDLRPLARWMDERGALAATLVTRDGEAVGMLLIPRGTRRESITLEEAHALRGLADAMSGACAGRSSLARSQLREREASERAEAAEHDLERRRHAEQLASARLVLGAMGQVSGVDVGRYSPAMRLARGALDRRVHMGAPVVVLAPFGLDPVPHLAEAHLSGPRRGTPFVVVDATASREHDLRRWNDRTASPLALAQGGLLVLADGAALPRDIQRLLGEALAARRAPWEQAEPLDLAIALTSVVPLADLGAGSWLDPALGSRFRDAGESEVRLPALKDRPEDLRALLSDRLAREGLRRRGAPVGIEDAAFALFMDYPFPGDYAELMLLARRLVTRTSGDVVRAQDIRDLGLVPSGAPIDVPIDVPTDLLRVNVRANRGMS
jgi:hypothetical protein